MPDNKYNISSRMNVPHPAEDGAIVEQLRSYEHSLEMEWGVNNVDPVVDDVPKKDDSIVPKKSVTSKDMPVLKKSSYDSMFTKSGAFSGVKNKIKSIKQISSIKKMCAINTTAILSPITNSPNTISDFCNQKYTALRQKISGLALKNMSNPFGIRAKNFYGRVGVQARLSYMTFKAICMMVANLAKKYAYITKVYVMHMVNVYINAKNSLSRKSGTVLLLIGLGIVLFQQLSMNIPSAILPLTHVSSAGTLDSVGSSPLPIKSDSTFEDNIFTTSYRIEKTVKKGNTLGSVLNRADISNDKRRNAMFRSMRQVFNPRNVFVGQKIIFDVVGGYSSHMQTHVQSMEIIINAEKSVVVSWDSSKNKYIAKMQYHPLKAIFKSAEGEIKSSLYLAMEKQDVKRGAIVDFITLFSFDVDFQRDIRKGDKFDIVYKEFLSTDGVYVRSSDISVAELSVQGNRRRYYQFTAKNGRTGYYDSLGKSGRKALMKTPIEGARLSSSFGNRLHPILGYTKLHNGTDFAAPRGTPIFAAGDGVVEYAGRKGANGIYVRIYHNGTYKTSYAHMSGIAKGVRNGRSVKQGKVIGYVGSTGRSTGNHLHYSVFKNGKPINSRLMKLPSGGSLKGDDLVLFKKIITPLMKDGQ